MSGQEAAMRTPEDEVAATTVEPEKEEKVVVITQSGSAEHREEKVQRKPYLDS